MIVVWLIFDRDSRSKSGRISRFGAHVPVPGRPCASARSAARSAPDTTFFASSWATMEERLPRLLPSWGQLPEQELLLQVLPSPRLPWTTGSANFFVAKREKRGVTQMMSPGERETIAVRPMLRHCLSLYRYVHLCFRYCENSPFRNGRFIGTVPTYVSMYFVPD